MVIIIPIRDTLTAPQMAEAFCDHVWKRVGMPELIISDRGTQYTMQFTKGLHELTNTKTNISTTFHPQTDGQTERLIAPFNEMRNRVERFSSRHSQPQFRATEMLR
jgi:hypothetical protein